MGKKGICNEDSDANSPENNMTETLTEPLKKKKKGNNLYKPPTSEELNNLREAETLFHSSLFRLQTDEFLREVKIKDKWKKKFEKWLECLKAELLSLKHGKAYQLSDKSWLKKKKLQFPLPECESRGPLKGVFKFVPPNNIQVVGSFGLGITSKLNSTADLSLTVPKDFWQHSDYLNGAYNAKKALYLCHICWALRKSPLVEKASFSCFQGDPSCPILILVPKGEWKVPFKVCLLPTPPPGYFSLSRFRPATNNVRPSWFFRGETNVPEDIPTPVYNSSVASDLLLMEHVQYLQENLKDAQGVKDALVLLGAWLRHRGISQGYGAFSSFLMTMFVCHLLSTRRISWMMSSYQVIRNVFLELAQSDWTKTGLGLSKSVVENQPSLEDFHKHYDVVFVDPSGFVNLTAHLSTATFKRLKHEAQIGVDLLNSFWNDSFEALFMVPVPFGHKFDHLFSLPEPAELEMSVHMLDLQSLFLDSSGNVTPALIPTLLKTLERALGKRITLIDYYRSTTPEWLPDEPPPGELLCGPLMFGLIFDPEFSGTVLERGPPADQPEAGEFRSFWGEKSELRRFQDGGICEAVLWPAKGIAECRLISKDIVQFVLEKHCAISSVKYIGDQVDKFWDLPRLKIPEGQLSYGSGEEAHLALTRSMDTLSKSLRQLKGLSLTVTSVQGISPCFRFTEVFPALPSNFRADQKLCSIFENKCLKLKEDLDHCPAYVHPLEVILHMEGSGKWPDTVEAVQRVKAALHLQLADVLSKELYLTTLPTTTHLDVIKDGYVFRLKVACRKELVLLKQVPTTDGTLKIRETEEYHKLNLATEALPQLTSTLHGIQQQHSTFGISCRLAKRWLASHHLLLTHIPEVCVELLVAHLFLHSAPFTHPNSPMTAFVRFLTLLAHHDWKTQPLIINLNQTFKKEDVSEIQSHFTSNRPILPAMFLATPLDKANSVWTRKAPTGPVLHRITTLAEASLQAFDSFLEKPDQYSVQAMFTPSLDIYDVLIHLLPRQVPKHYQALRGSSFGLPPVQVYSRSKQEVMPVVGFDPVELYLRDLKNTFEEFALFFYDVFGGTYIGVVWKPNAFDPKPFKVSHVNSRMEGSSLAEGKKCLVPNVEAILQDMAILGSGLVQHLETKMDKWSID